MEIIAMELSTLLLLAAIILLFRRQRGAAEEQDAAELKHVEALDRSSDLTQQIGLGALENLHKNLSSLEQRTTFVERKLGSLMEAPVLERREHYRAAAFLLAAGHDGSRVASMLDLPLAQVEMIGELKKILASDAKSAAEAAPRQPVKTAKGKAVPRSAKPKLRPILLTDIVESGHAVNGNGRLSDRRVAVNGAAA